jgi:hypothetical protein
MEQERQADVLGIGSKQKRYGSPMQVTYRAAQIEECVSIACDFVEASEREVEKRENKGE